MNGIALTFGIAILLSVGLIFAKAAQLIRLPSVTGFILAGLFLGPSFLEIVPVDVVGKLEHFTQIALMLIAFGIGEHIELRRLVNIARDVGYISVIQAVGSFVFVGLGVFLTSRFINDSGTSYNDTLILSLLLGAVGVATAPAALLHVVREMGAKGPLTSTLMAVVAVDDGIAIMFFGVTMSVVRQIAGPGAVSAVYAVTECLYEIGFSLVIGVVTGLIIDFVLNKLHNRGEMLTAGLALLLLCGEITRVLHLSPLLAGMAVGFTIINRAERDVRLFRALNAFEPPIYVLFFTLAGLHLDFGALGVAGWIGLVYFVMRIIGKYTGTWLGAVLSGASSTVRNYLGLALVPQAGVAIGLVLMVSNDTLLTPWSVIITPVVLAGVFFSELSGPLFARYTLEKAGEAEVADGRPESRDKGPLWCKLWFRSPEGISLPPWEGEKLQSAGDTSGVVVFGAFHYATVRGLARVATILSHYLHAVPMSLRVLEPSEMECYKKSDDASLFMAEIDEVKSLGYSLATEVVFEDPADGVVASLEYNDARAVVLAYPVDTNPRNFHRILDGVASKITCPLVAVRFVGPLYFDRILVPFLALHELDELLSVLEAIAMTTMPRVTFLQLLHFDSRKEDVQAHEHKLREWLTDNFCDISSSIIVEAVESRLERTLQEARYHSLVIMAAAHRYGASRMFFGSLSNSVVQNCQRSIMVVYTPGRQNDFSLQ